MRMSHAKVAPEGLKPQECERNAGRSRTLILYIPEKDVIQEAVDSRLQYQQAEVDIAPQGGVAHPGLDKRDPRAIPGTGPVGS